MNTFVVYITMREHLGDFEQLVLFAVLALGDAAYGAEIRREIEARTGRRVLVGAVYMVLDRLERRRLVSSVTSDPTPARGGRRRRLYELLPEGARLLNTAHQRQLSMAKGLVARLERLAKSSS